MMLMDAVLVLADEKSPTNIGPDFGKAGPFGLTVVVLLMVGTFFLIRSMNSHLRKLPETFDPEHPEAGRRPAHTCASTSTTRCTGSSGPRKRWPKRSLAMCPSCCRSGMRPAIGVM
ncbi:Uncharacterised protein [Mycobacteroides abscessus subsp. abscessus]|nr:Uncharacterised protein [Mycobacteroides abscessus subsp. abscessus]